MAGIAAGKSGGFGILQTINGLKYKKNGLRVLSVGEVTYKRTKLFPLFFDVRWNLNS